MSTMDLHSRIVRNYQQKNYSACLTLLSEAPNVAQNAPQYKVLKAACFVHLGRNIELAHAIFDDVLIKENRNSFAYYGKGLAYFSTKKMSQAIRCFDKAIELDISGSMGKALELKQKAVGMMKEVSYKEDVATYEDEHDSAIERKGREMVEKHFEARIEKVDEDIFKSVEITPTKKIKLSDEEEKSETTPKKNKKVKKTSVPPTPSLSDYDSSKTCKICSKTFTKRFSLTRHLRLHNNVNGFKCSRCDLSYLHRTELKRHETTHKKTYDYTCRDCGKRFVNKENFKKHRLDHVTTTTIDQEFSCQFCEKTFKSEKLQKYHETLHNNKINNKKGNADKSEIVSDNTNTSLDTKIADKEDETCGNNAEIADKMEDKALVEATNDKIKDIPDEEENDDNTKTTIEKESENSTHDEKPFGCNLCNTSYTSIDCLGQHFISFHGVGK